jgi:menaquinone-dependent protoporphyrinogen IX oxidase
MNKKVLVVYQSQYGATRQYAAWIAEELGAELRERKNAKPSGLSDYDCVVYGGGLYASGILGADWAAKTACKNLVIFTVGLADPANTDYSAILSKNFPQKIQHSLKVFHFRGSIDYKKLSLIHRIMMAMMKWMTVGRKKPEEWTEEEKLFVSTYGNQVDFTDRLSITPLVGYVCELTRRNA